LQTFHKRDRWFKAMFYGANGSGKTELAGTSVDVPAMCDVIMFNVEKGEMTIEATPRIKNKDRMVLANVDNITQAEHIKQWIQAHCKFRDEGNREKLIDLEIAIGFREANDRETTPRIFRTVIVDTVTEVQAFAMYQLLGITTSLGLDADVPDREWSHYNKMLNRMEIFLRVFRDIPMHVIMLCQENMIQDETKKRIYSPMLEGQLAKRIQGYSDAVGHIQRMTNDKGEDIHRLWLKPLGTHAAKNRAALKVPYIDDATLADLFKAFGLDTQHAPKEDTENSAS
jgi:hypothetical protein